jgi:hypothetical protein
VALRGDHHWRLISYSYYVKYATRSGTFFRHIDLNITQYLINGRGGNMIQGTVSLDDEQDDCCTEIILGMNSKEKIQDWYDRIVARHNKADVMDDFVNRVQDKKIWSPEDAEYFKTDFTPQPCNNGKARISDPRNIPLQPQDEESLPPVGG